MPNICLNPHCKTLYCQGCGTETCPMRKVKTKKKVKAIKAIVTALASGAKEYFEIPADPDEMNDNRAEFAEDTLLHFAKEHGELIDGALTYTETDGEECDLTVQNLTDLICDFGHFCDRNDIEFAEILRRAQYHYSEETDNEGKQEFSAAIEIR
jgi:hypothetical protein